jgi:hypothetical protein
MSRGHWNSNLIWIQIILKFIKDLEKERFSYSLIEIGPKPRPNPVGPFFPPPHCFRVEPSSAPSCFGAAQRSQQRQHVACTGPTDALRPPRDDKAESEVELEMMPGKISPISNTQRKRHRILMEKCVGLESAPITSTRMETHINRNRFHSDFVHPELKP